MNANASQTTSIEEIEREIDHTRAALDHTIRALRTELSPRHRAQVAWRSTKARTARSVRHTVDWAMVNPLPVTVGAIVLIAASIAIAARRRWY